MPDGADAARQGVLLWLNDRRGKDVAAEVIVWLGDVGVSVLSAEGELRHWSEGRAAIRAASRDEVAGVYYVGDRASLDLSDVRPLAVAEADDELSIRLDERTTLVIVEQEDVPC